jgi:cellulose biosynthesis protein BcsQ
MKGGVGKTATVVGVAEALAAGGKSVLVIDLDPQANASICIAGDALLADLLRRRRTIDGFIEEFMRKGWDANFEAFINSGVSNVSHRDKRLKLSLLASSPALRELERNLIHSLTLRQRSWADIVEALWDLMQEELKRSTQNFDVALIDCAPGISILTEVSIRLADLAIVPTIPDFLSTFGLDAFCANLWDRNLEGAKDGPARRLPHVLATRCRPTVVHTNTIAALRQEASKKNPPFQMFKTVVPERAAIASALSDLNAHVAYDEKWTEPVTEIFIAIAGEIHEVFDDA